MLFFIIFQEFHGRRHLGTGLNWLYLEFHYFRAFCLDVRAKYKKNAKMAAPMKFRNRLEIDTKHYLEIKATLNDMRDRSSRTNWYESSFSMYNLGLMEDLGHWKLHKLTPLSTSPTDPFPWLAIGPWCIISSCLPVNLIRCRHNYGAGGGMCYGMA